MSVHAPNLKDPKTVYVDPMLLSKSSSSSSSSSHIEKKPLHVPPKTTRDSNHQTPIIHGLLNTRIGTKTVKHEGSHLSPVERMLVSHKKIQEAIKTAIPQKDAAALQLPLSEEMQGLKASLDLALPKNAALSQKIYNFCNTLAQKTQNALQGISPQAVLSNPQYLEAQEFLAEVIYLVDKDAQGFTDLLSQNDASQAIKQKFAQELDKISQIFQILVKTANGIRVQDGETMLGAQKPIGLSEILITDSGFLNIGLAEQLKKVVLDDQENHDYEENMVRVLDELRNRPALRQKINDVVRPTSLAFSSNTVIKAVLGLNPDEVITDNHAKKTALSALLSSLRQGPVGSCFATYLGIELLSMRLDKCLDDFASIIKNDELSRTVDGGRKDFNYVLDISDDDVNAKFTIQNNGTFSSGAPLSTSPGISAALRIMGIREADLQAILTGASQQLLKTSKSCTASKLISTVATMIDKTKVDQLTGIGKFAFSAQTNNALLRVWESTIAGMAESSPTSYVHGTIIQSLKQALTPVLKPVKASENAILQKINQVFVKTINDSMVLRFDPNIQTAGVSGDGHSTEGGFVIYEGDAATVSATGRRVDDPVKFQTFVQNLVQKTSATIRPTLRVKSDITSLDTIIQRVTTYVMKDPNFLKLVVTNYDPENKNVPNPIANWQQLEHTPWIDKTGDDNGEVLRVYMGLPRPTPTTFVPKNAQDLLRFGITFAKDLQAKFHYLDDNVPSQTFPCSSPTHAFSFMPEHPTMAAAVRSQMSVDDWINANVIQPGLALTKARVTKATRDQIVDYAHQNLVSEKHQEKVQKELDKKIGEETTLRDLKGKILSVISDSTKTSVANLKDASKMLDSFMLKANFNDDLMTKWQQSVVHFADSNWNDGVNDIHFCIYFNPSTQRVEFGTVFDDGTNLDTISQSDWVANQQWDFYRVDLRNA